MGAIVGHVNPAALPSWYFTNAIHKGGYFIDGEEYGAVDIVTPARFRAARGDELGLDNNYVYAVFPDGRIEYAFYDNTGSAWGDGVNPWLVEAYVGSDSSFNGVPNPDYKGVVAAYSDLTALGFSPIGADAHGYPLFGRGWVPASAAHPYPRGTFFENYIGVAILSLLTWGVGAAASVVATASIAAEGAAVAAESGAIAVTVSDQVAALSSSVTVSAPTFAEVVVSSPGLAALQSSQLGELASSVAATLEEPAVALEGIDALQLPAIPSDLPVDALDTLRDLPPIPESVITPTTPSSPTFSDLVDGLRDLPPIPESVITPTTPASVAPTALDELATVAKAALAKGAQVLTGKVQQLIAPKKPAAVQPSQQQRRDVVVGEVQGDAQGAAALVPLILFAVLMAVIR